MEGLFSTFPNFFANSDPPVQRDQANLDQFPKDLGQKIPHCQDKGTEKDKVQDPSQNHPGHEVDAQVPVPRRHGVAQEGGQDQGPVEKVQHRAQPGNKAPGAEKAEEVIEEAQKAPQGQSPQEAESLAGHRDLHPSPQKPG